MPSLACWHEAGKGDRFIALGLVTLIILSLFFFVSLFFMCSFQFILFSYFFVAGKNGDTISLSFASLSFSHNILEIRVVWWKLVEFNLANATTYWEVIVIDLVLSSLNKKLRGFQNVYEELVQHSLEQTQSILVLDGKKLLENCPHGLFVL